MFDLDPADKPMDGHAASAFLTERGFPYAEGTLTRLRCVGGGPVFLKHGRRVVYRPSALVAWIAARTLEKTDTTCGGTRLSNLPNATGGLKADALKRETGERQSHGVARPE